MTSYQSKARMWLPISITSNWHPISFRFGVIAAYCSNFWTICISKPPFGELEDNLGLIGKHVVKLNFFARCYGWGTTSDHGSKIGDLAPTWSVDPKLSGIRSRRSPPIIFARLVRPRNALQLCRWQFSHKETLQQTFFKRSVILQKNRHFCSFHLPFGGLRSNVRWSPEAHWKVHSGLPISVNWTFFARCYGWGATSDYWFKIGNFAPMGPVDPKFQVEGVASTNDCFSQKTRLSNLLYGIRIWTRFFFHFVTIHTFDRQTKLSSLDRICIPCSTVKTTC